MTPPPLLVTFPTLGVFLRALSEQDRAENESTLQSLHNLRLPPVASARTLAVLFGYSTRFVMSLAARPQKYYRFFDIPKGASQRHIEAPRIALKIIQAWLGCHLARAVSFPAPIHGFVPGRSTISAAHQHLHADCFISLDIHNFFPSTPRSKVRAVFEQLQFPSKGIDVLTNLTTIFGRLPQGSPASPVLANLAFLAVDKVLQGVADNASARYTRYADDLVFSGKGKRPEQLVPTISKVIAGFGWTIAATKVTVAERPNSLRVHGLVVNGENVRLPKSYRNRLRMMKFALQNKKLDASLERRYRGHLAYAKAVDEFQPPE